MSKWQWGTPIVEEISLDLGAFIIFYYHVFWWGNPMENPMKSIWILFSPLWNSRYSPQQGTNSPPQGNHTPSPHGSRQKAISLRREGGKHHLASPWDVGFSQVDPSRSKYPLVMTNIAMGNDPFIGGLPILKMAIFNSYVSLPEGKWPSTPTSTSSISCGRR